MGKILINKYFDVSNWKDPYSLYDFTTFTFTSAGVTGASGPTLAQCRTAYSSASWTQNNSFFNMTVNGIQIWTVPDNGIYRIEAFGASGGSTTQYSSSYPGRGARIQGDFTLTKGEYISIAIGQVGQSSYYGSGGGGGTFVIRNSNNSPLVIAGGGGGAQQETNYLTFSDASITSTAKTANSLITTYGGGGGGGFLSNGQDRVGYVDSGGKGYPSGLIGGTNVCQPSYAGAGGFGGGGAGEWCTYGSSGAGGGYSGGSGGTSGSGGLAGYYAQGGGGSINNGTNQSSTEGSNNSAGYVIITKL